MGVFDGDWRIQKVDAVLSAGEELLDSGSVKVLRLLDQPMTDWLEVVAFCKKLHRAYAGTAQSFTEGKRRDVRKAKALRVDRNPPDFANRYSS